MDPVARYTLSRNNASILNDLILRKSVPNLAYTRANITVATLHIETHFVLFLPFPCSCQRGVSLTACRWRSSAAFFLASSFFFGNISYSSSRGTTTETNPLRSLSKSTPTLVLQRKIDGKSSNRPEAVVFITIN